MLKHLKEKYVWFYWLYIIFKKISTTIYWKEYFFFPTKKRSIHGIFLFAGDDSNDDSKSWCLQQWLHRGHIGVVSNSRLQLFWNRRMSFTDRLEWTESTKKRWLSCCSWRKAVMVWICWNTARFESYWRSQSQYVLSIKIRISKKSLDSW